MVQFTCSVGIMMIGQPRLHILVQFTCTVPIGRVRRSHLHSVKWCDGVNWVRCEIVGSRFGGTVISTALVRSVLWPSTWNVMWAQNQHVAELASGHTYWATIAIVVGQSPNRLHLVILVTLTGQWPTQWMMNQPTVRTVNIYCPVYLVKIFCKSI